MEPFWRWLFIWKNLDLFIWKHGSVINSETHQNDCLYGTILVRYKQSHQNGTTLISLFIRNYFGETVYMEPVWRDCLYGTILMKLFILTRFGETLSKPFWYHLYGTILMRLFIWKNFDQTVPYKQSDDQIWFHINSLIKLWWFHINSLTKMVYMEAFWWDCLYEIMRLFTWTQTVSHGTILVRLFIWNHFGETVYMEAFPYMWNDMEPFWWDCLYGTILMRLFHMEAFWWDCLYGSILARLFIRNHFGETVYMDSFWSHQNDCLYGSILTRLFI